MNSCLNSFDSGKGWLEPSCSAEVLYFELDCGVKQSRWAQPDSGQVGFTGFLKLLKEVRTEAIRDSG